MILEGLRTGAKRDSLTPHFTFTQLMRDKLDSDIFKEIQRLRYEVYCLECNYLDAREYDEGIESDTYDARSLHVGAHDLTGALVGTVRLVLADESERLPFEEHCKVFDDFLFPPRKQCAEVSRLVVRKGFRRRPGDVCHDSNPQVLLGMYREMYRYSRQNGIRYWFAAMEKALARSMHRIGFHFVPAGPATDYYGPVTPYLVDLWSLHDNLDLFASNAGEGQSRRAGRWNLFGSV